MTDPGAFLICRMGANGQPSFLLNCDDAALRWLADAFRGIARRRGFTLGDGRPVGSDGVCLIRVTPCSQGQSAAINRLSDRGFAWGLPVADARRCADLIGAMAAFKGPCHHYLEADDPNLPVILVSRGEYDTDTLRRMRADLA